MFKHKKLVAALGLIATFLFIGFRALAQDAAPVDVPVQDFLAQVITAVKGFGGLTWMAKVGSICIILIASMKVSVLNKWVWSKLGTLQGWVAPLLALVGGLLANGSALTWPMVFAYLGAGAGATYLHDILDLLKKIPGLGTAWVAIIDVIASVLGGPTSKTIAKG